jgi:hypothetical protein
MTNFTRILSIVLLLIATCSLRAYAQSEFSGMYRNYNGIRISDGNDFIVGRNLIRTNFRSDVSNARLYLSGELLNTYTQRRDSMQFRLREAYGDFYFKASEIRFGKQIIARGRSNGVILTDILSPYDLSEFLTQDLSDLRQGVFAFSYAADVGPHHIDLIVNPIIAENLLPSAGSTWDFRPELDLPIAVTYSDLKRSYSINDMQFSAQFRYRPSTRLNVDLSAQYWEYPMPVYSKTAIFDTNTSFVELSEVRRRSPMFGLSGDFGLSKGLLATFEGTYYTKRTFDKVLPDFSGLPTGGAGSNLDPTLIAVLQAQFNDADKYLVEKPFAQFMGGVDYSSGTTFISVQGIIEYISNHESIVAQRRVNSISSLLVRKSWLDERIRAQSFIRYGLVGQDYWINPEFSWKPTSEVLVSVGAQLFGGPTSDDVFDFRLSRFQENSFLFTKLTWNW